MAPSIRTARLVAALLAGALLASAALAGAILARPVGAAKGPAIGEPAPPFTLPDLEGRPVSLASFRGRVVILHFWATWCPVCRDEMPILEEAARARAAGLAVLGINLGEKKDRVAAYVRKQGIAFPVLLDARGKVASAYGVLSLPITLIIDRDGRLVEAVRMGSLSRADLEERLGRVLPRSP